VSEGVAFLLRKFADEIIRVYRGNLDFLAGQGVNVHVEAASGNDEELRGDLPAVSRATESNESRGFPDAALDRVLQFRISEGSNARIHLRGRPRL